jgi:thiol-disulfide isomerase/thioredoxin
MRSFLFITIILALAAFAGCRPAAAPVAVSNRPISINDRPTTNLPLPPAKSLTDMSWTDAGDKIQKLSDLGGKAVILDFWATNCPPCRQEIPHLNSLIAKYGADNLQVVGLHVGDEEDRREIPNFTQTTHLDYPIAFPEDELSRYVFSDGDEIPRTLIIDRDGRVVRRFIGFGPSIQKDLDAAVEQAVKTN